MNSYPTIEEQWEAYKKYAVPKGASREQVADTWVAFYSGAIAMQNVQVYISGHEGSEEDAMEILEKAYKELEDFVAKMNASLKASRAEQPTSKKTH